MDDAVLTVEPLSSEPLWKRCLKFFGLMNLTLHEAVMSGSVRHVKMTMTAFQKGKRANPQLVDAYDVSGGCRTVRICSIVAKLFYFCLCCGL
jgi:hypothetical protein